MSQCRLDPEDRGRHTWEAKGLVTIGDRVLNVRRCVRCGEEQVKPYGGKGPWKINDVDPTDEAFQ